MNYSEKKQNYINYQLMQAFTQLSNLEEDCFFPKDIDNDSVSYVEETWNILEDQIGHKVSKLDVLNWNKSKVEGDVNLMSLFTRLNEEVNDEVWDFDKQKFIKSKRTIKRSKSEVLEDFKILIDALSEKNSTLYEENNLKKYEEVLLSAKKCWSLLEYELGQRVMEKDILEMIKENEYMPSFYNLLIGLSPETLSHDGEAEKSDMKITLEKITKEWKDLEKEYDIKVLEEDVINWKNKNTNKKDPYKKSAYEIMHDFGNLMIDLSPENLYADGEADKEEVKERLDYIQNKWKDLELQIGRSLSEKEVTQFFDAINMSKSEEKNAFTEKKYTKTKEPNPKKLFGY